MTLMELMVASSLGLLIIGMTLTTTLANRDAYGYDIVRTRLNQNLRSAFDVINTEVRQAGERLPAAFPAIQIVNGASGAPDTLILRRNLMDEVLTVCRAIVPATSGPNVYTNATGSGVPPACVYGAQTNSFNAWHNYRLAKGGATHVVDAYIFNLTTKLGQFFKYDTDASTASPASQYIRNQTGSWSNSYAATGTAVYMLSEWKFALSTVAGQTDLLQLTENQKTTEVKNIVYGVKDIQFRALMQDGTTKTTFGSSTDDWTQLQAIEVTITGSDTFRGRDITSTLTTQLFPRNVLSN